MVAFPRETVLATLLLGGAPTAVTGFWLPPSGVFTATRSRRHLSSKRALTALQARYKDEGDSSDDGGNSQFDVEAARNRLEALLTVDDRMPEQEASETCETPPSEPSEPEQKASPTPRSLFDLFFRPKPAPTPPPHPPKTVPPLASAYRYDDKSLSGLSPKLRKALTLETLLEHPPLTAMEIERREIEIQLLGQLADSDDAMDDLWSLWFHERGVEAANQIHKVEELTADPSRWGEAEQMIVRLVTKYGTTWCEPINRLATLYYMQGKLVESEQLCRIVLSIKPWHFGALSGIVMVYASLQKPHMAKQWAARRLPTLPQIQPEEQPQQAEDPAASADNVQDAPPQDDAAAKKSPANRRRQLWVHTATEQASSMLKRKVEDQKAWWGAPDTYAQHKRQKLDQMLTEMEDDISPFSSSTSNDLSNSWQ